MVWELRMRQLSVLGMRGNSLTRRGIWEFPSDWESFRCHLCHCHHFPTQAICWWWAQINDLCCLWPFLKSSDSLIFSTILVISSFMYCIYSLCVCVCVCIVLYLWKRTKRLMTQLHTNQHKQLFYVCRDRADPQDPTQDQDLEFDAFLNRWPVQLISPKYERIWVNWRAAQFRMDSEFWMELQLFRWIWTKERSRVVAALNEWLCCSDQIWCRWWRHDLYKKLTWSAMNNSPSINTPRSWRRCWGDQSRNDERSTPLIC